MRCVYYHWFEKENSTVSKIIRCPIIQSIATLRAVDSEIPIKVLCPKTNQNWSEFPEVLNFEVIKKEFYLQNYKHKKGWELLSRLFDLYRIPKEQNEEVFYCDSDVFWLKSPWPLKCNPSKFCFDGYNSGLFYYKHESPEVERFFELFEAYTIGSLNNSEIDKLMKTYVTCFQHSGEKSWYDVWDEMILTYIFHEHKDLFNQIYKEEHCCARDLKVWVEPENVRAFHCNGTIVCNEATTHLPYVQHSRGLMCVLVKEWWDAINKVLPEHLIKELYTKAELEKYLPVQFSFLNEPERIVNAQADDEHFWINPKVNRIDPSLLL